MEANLKAKEAKILKLSSLISQLEENQEKISSAVSVQKRAPARKESSTRQLLNTLLIQNLMNKHQEVEQGQEQQLTRILLSLVEREQNQSQVEEQLSLIAQSVINKS